MNSLKTSLNIPLLAETDAWRKVDLPTPAVDYEVTEPPFDLIDGLYRAVPFRQSGQYNPAIALERSIGTCIAISCLAHTALTLSNARITPVIVIGGGHAQTMIFDPKHKDATVVDNGYDPAKARYGHEHMADNEGYVEYIRITPFSPTLSTDTKDPKTRTEHWLRRATEMTESGIDIGDVWTRWYTGSSIHTTISDIGAISRVNSENPTTNSNDEVNIGHHTLITGQVAKDFVDYFTYKVLPVDSARRNKLNHALWAFKGTKEKIANPHSIDPQ